MFEAFIEKIKEQGREEGREEIMKLYGDAFDKYILSPQSKSNRIVENLIDYIIAQKEIDEMQQLTFGNKINVLLITDRLYGYAMGLRGYLENSVDISVDLVFKFEKVQEIIAQKQIDFFVIVGMLESKMNYKSIQAVRKSNEHAKIIMYALLDSHIMSICAEYDIKLTFHRAQPMSDFVLFMCTV